MRLGTSLRIRPAAETAAVARRLMRSLGIRRVHDLTPLDSLGVPVFSSVRPGGSTVQVHMGKGVHSEDARTGALMEAVEYAVAEQASAAAPIVRRTLQSLMEQWPEGLAWADWAPKLGLTAPQAQEPLLALFCEELGSRRKLLLPAELVLMPCPSLGLPTYFDGSSNGLASGNSLQEATLHALFEVLERDAVAMNLARDESALLCNSDLPEPFNAWAVRWRRQQVVLTVRYLPNDFGLPAFVAALHQTQGADRLLARGWGLHADREVALARAVCEAAQTRIALRFGDRPEVPRLRRSPSAISTISAISANGAGGTDGADGAIGAIRSTAARAMATERARERAGEERLFLSLTRTDSRCEFKAIAQLPCTSVPAALATLRQRLAAQGMRHIFRYRMQPPGGAQALQGLHVVKVIVPRCESALQGAVRMGPRLMARVLGAR